MINKLTMLTVRGQIDVNGDFDWTNAFVDAGILTAVSVGVALSAIGSDGIFAANEICTLVSAAIVEFFGFIAAKRKLRE